MTALAKQDQGVAVPEQLDVARVVSAVLEASKDPNVDAAKAQIMMNMVLQLEERNAAKLFAQAVKRAQQKMPRVSPNGVIMNKDGATARSRYSKYEDVMLFLNPILDQEGLSINFDGGKFKDGYLTVTMEISHDAGHKETRETTMPLADVFGASAPQKMGATITYAKRYAVMQYFNVIQEGIDNDAQGHENDPLTAEQAGRINDLLIGSQADKEKFLKFMSASSVEAITQGKFNYACEALRRKGKK